VGNKEMKLYWLSAVERERRKDKGRNRLMIVVKESKENS